MSDSDSPPSKRLNKLEHRFRDEYLIDLNGTRAIMRSGWRGKRPDVKASKMLARPHVRAAVDKAIAERAARTGITADQVVQELEAIARADAGELMEYRREACRYCWGTGHRYHHTPAEMERRRAEYDTIAGLNSSCAPFDEQGGVGFNPKREPHPDCPECFGEGVGREFFHDTRVLSVDGRALFAGVKVTKDGVEIKTHSKDRALEALARHLGMDRKLLELSGAIEIRDVDSLTDAELAAIAATGRPASAEPEEGAG